MDAEEVFATKESLAEGVRARSSFYRMLSQLYFRPLAESQIDELASLDFESLILEESDDLLASGYNDLWRYLRRRHSGTRQELACDFTMAFYGRKTYRGHSAMPYASLFTDGEVLMSATTRKAYLAFKNEGLKIKKGIDLPSDHLSFMLEFMGIIADREKASIEADETSGALKSLNLQQDFLMSSILNWYPRFHALSNKVVETRFYRGVLKLTKGYLLQEKQEINVEQRALKRGINQA